MRWSLRSPAREGDWLCLIQGGSHKIPRLNFLKMGQVDKRQFLFCQGGIAVVCGICEDGCFLQGI